MKVVLSESGGGLKGKCIERRASGLRRRGVEMAFLDKKRKKRKKLVFAPKEYEHNELGSYIQGLEAHYGFYCCEEAKLAFRMSLETC